MQTFFAWAALLLLIDLCIGLTRVLRGPSAADRMIAAQLFGTTGVAILLLLAEAWGDPALRNIALTFALLAVLATSVFVKHAHRHGEEKG